MAKRKKCIIISAILAAAAALTAFLIYGNSSLMTTEYTVANENIPADFAGFRIAQVSDLHNAGFGRENHRLIQAIENAAPDIIVITGDLIDSRRTNIGIAVDFAQKASAIAPVYYATGNHESRIDDLSPLIQGLEHAGVTILRGSSTVITRGGSEITLCGIEDPAFTANYLDRNAASIADAALGTLPLSDSAYTILLSHRPEIYDTYVKNGVNLVFSGHAHGGQVRLPFLGGLIAPGQGLFPEYDSGMFTSGGTTMIVSRGLGNSLFPFRIGNRPELVIAELNNA